MSKNAPPLLTQADYARSRKARGLTGGTRESVRKAVDQGRITAFGPDKLIDQVLADQQWERNTRARVAVGGAGEASRTQPAHDDGVAPRDLVDAAAVLPPPAAPEPSGQLTGDQGYLRSRAQQAAADARTAEIKLAELEGSLVRIDQVRAELAAKLSPVREGLLQLPARIASQLAGQSDPGRIQTLLEAEIHQVLAPLGKAAAVATEQATA